MLLIHKRAIFIAAGVIAVTTVFIIGYFSGKSVKTTCSSLQKGDDQTSENRRQEIHDQIIGSLDAKAIKESSRFLTLQPHAAALPRNNELIREIHKRFSSYGFEASYYNYDVLLSYPKVGQPNYAYVIDESGSTIFRSKGTEDKLVESENVDGVLPPFNAFGPAGSATGDVVYVNYASFEDFEELEKIYNISVQRKIVLARYGKLFRGDKVANAERRGAVGVLLYSDPFDVGPVPDDQLFPNGRWLSRDGIQRGSVGTFEGDALSPGYPAKAWVFREKPENVEGIPKIPVQPISALDAVAYLSRLTGPAVPSHWIGGLNLTYRFGPMTNMKAKLEVFNELQIRTITNVMGTIKGLVEPDRYVIIGNHIDAWVFGAVDPSSGTAVMLEIARALGEQLKKGWRPRRTIKFCGWDGEEAGILGSSEWVEEYANELRDRAVLYINVDSAVSGNYSLEVSSSPMLHKLIYDVLDDVSDPHNSSMTVLARSSQAYPSAAYPGQMDIGGLGSGSDYLSFYQTIGVPAIDLAYKQTDLNKKYKIGSYPMYHSMHDTFYWMERFVDPQFTCHLTVAKVVGYILLRVADTPLLPFDGDRYAEGLLRNSKALEKRINEKGGGDAAVFLMYLNEAAMNFSSAMAKFKDAAKRADLGNPLLMRLVNDEISQIEKGFIYPFGLPGRPDIKHYIMAPSLYNQYGSSTFPAVEDLLYDIEKTKNWDAVKRQMTITTFIIQSVAQKLMTAL